MIPWSLPADPCLLIGKKVEDDAFPDARLWRLGLVVDRRNHNYRCREAVREKVVSFTNEWRAEMLWGSARLGLGMPHGPLLHSTLTARNLYTAYVRCDALRNSHTGESPRH